MAYSNAWRMRIATALSLVAHHGLNLNVSHCRLHLDSGVWQ
jgi:hypothetical protein